MAEESVQVSVDRRGVATVCLNRPEVNNAYDGKMIIKLIEAIRIARSSDAVRVVVIKGNGRHFQAGADLGWIQSVREQDAKENLAVSARTAAAVQELNELEKPVVSLVHGACFGGGTGMIAASDVVIASEDAIFSITEARWGLNAAVIVPVLNAAIGARQARRYAITTERFDARRALEIGLVHEVVKTGELDAAAAPVIDALLHVAPGALATTKRDFLAHSRSAQTAEEMSVLVQRHAEGRQTPEAEEGLASFLEKRKPSWYPQG